MNADEFVSRWRQEKDTLLAQFLNPSSEARVARHLAALGLSEEQRAGVAQALDAALTDSFYTLLLGLDGAASIGGVQEQFRILTGSGAPVGAPGELEASAWKHFHSR